MAIFTERNATWMRWITLEEFNDLELLRIITFFVFHSPCDGLSSMGRSIEEYGWTTPWKKTILSEQHLRRAATNYDLLYPSASYDGMENAFSFLRMLH